MGGCLSASGEGKESRIQRLNQARRNSLINKHLQESYDKERNIVKILLLGTGNSGKSTILKQFKLLHTEKGLGDLSAHRETISNNVTRGLVVLAQGVQDLEEIQEELSQRLKDIAEVLRIHPLIWDNIEFQGEEVVVTSLCNELWDSPLIKEVIQHESKLPMLEVPIEYFMQSFDRISKPDYSPSTDDILQARARTSGVVSIQFGLDNINCRMLDVGGQRNERKKWISHFDGVTAIMFLVSLSEYDKVLLEDSSTNRMHDALEVFRYIVECPYFEETNIILFLNKKDLFAEKIRKVDLRICFKDYRGEQEYEAAVEFIQNKFVNIFRKTKDTQNVDSMAADIYPFQTMATNTQNVRTVFNMCKHIIFKTNLASTGML